MKKQYINIIIPILLTLTGCGETGRTLQKKETVDVKYTLNGTQKPICHNADKKKEKIETMDDTLKICQWSCGRYNGSEPVFVTLSFTRPSPLDSSIWELTDEHIEEASIFKCKDA